MEQEKTEEVITEEDFKKLKESKFKQQLLPAWRPMPTVLTTSIIFTSIGVIFIVIGSILVAYSKKIVEKKIRYDNICTLGTTCTVNIKIEKEIKQPVMLYYELDNFYQNHRMYVKSKSTDQLKGKSFTYSEMDDSGDCHPVVSNKEMGKTTSVDQTTLVENDLAIPCGLIAKSYFTDTFTLKTSAGNSIAIDEKNIAWSSDLKRYKNVGSNWKKKQWLDMTDEHFIVWMRPAGLEGFRKLWGRIRTSLKGDYILTINNNYNVNNFNGKKYVVLSNANKFGGKNFFLGYSYIVVGIIAILAVVGFHVYDNFINTNKKKSS